MEDASEDPDDTAWDADDTDTDVVAEADAGWDVDTDFALSLVEAGGAGSTWVALVVDADAAVSEDTALVGTSAAESVTGEACVEALC